MPDENKYTVLRKIGYAIPVTCGLCRSGDFYKSDKSQWGTCMKHRYEHLKHDNPTGGRGISIVKGGTCPDAMADQSKVDELHAHVEFLEASGG